ncbi:hypothetical protein EDS67_00310 [candidate division KSB1 bacterium]|nr:MAG: hypothetical protein EDS67_00310 [candidate division KSB1 bacterium]MBC6946588.1 hypothetical protein [candidate division KSB1 bacterium]MCE7940183.1 hypothetical protein [Chlorobi bacterium CHB1]MDL1873852.1 hypothetical protein [Cytophagia bacterium CHB2]
MEEFYYQIHDLVNVVVDARVDDKIVKQIDFQIGYFRSNLRSDIAPYQIVVKPFEDFQASSECDLHTFHLVKGIPGKCLIDNNARLAFVKQKQGYTIYTDRGVLINLFIQFFLIEQGISLIHAAAIADRYGCVTLLPGAGGVGKTALLGYMVKEHNYRLLGDDIIGLNDQGYCLAFPRSFVLKEYHQSVYPEIFQRLNINIQQEKQRKLTYSINPTAQKFMRLIRENAPFLGITKSLLRRFKLYQKITRHSNETKNLPYLATVPVEEIFGPGIVANRGEIERILFLERYAGKQFKFAPLSEESLCRRMFAIINHEWVEIMRQLFTIGALEIENLPRYFDRLAATVRSGISGKKCEIFFIPDNASPRELEQYFIGHVNEIDVRNRSVVIRNEIDEEPATQNNSVNASI